MTNISTTGRKNALQYFAGFARRAVYLKACFPLVTYKICRNAQFCEYGKESRGKHTLYYKRTTLTENTKSFQAQPTRVKHVFVEIRSF